MLRTFMMAGFAAVLLVAAAGADDGQVELNRQAMADVLEGLRVNALDQDGFRAFAVDGVQNIESELARQ